MNVLLLLFCLGALGLFVFIFVIFAVIRYFNCRETMRQSEQGLSPPEVKKSKILLLSGMIITVLGLILTLGLYMIGYSAVTSYPLHLGPWMLGGLIPLFLGLGLILLHYITERE